MQGPEISILLALFTYNTNIHSVYQCLICVLLSLRLVQFCCFQVLCLSARQELANISDNLARFHCTLNMLSIRQFLFQYVFAIVSPSNLVFVAQYKAFMTTQRQTSKWNCEMQTLFSRFENDFITSKPVLSLVC